MRTVVRRIGTIAAAALLLGACGRTAPPAAPEAESAAASAGQADYVAPPEPSAAEPGADGAIVLSGISRPDALIRLASPDGSAVGTTASADGRWSLTVATGGQPRLFSLADAMDGRPLRARGYLAVLPLPQPNAAVLRPGTAAAPLGPRQAVQISAVDFDGAGAAMASGVAAPGEAVRLALDGAYAGEDMADGRGRFTVSLTGVLPAGAHTLAAATHSGRAEAAFEAGPAAPIAVPPFNARRLDRAWRIDWMTPGGGIQTTLLFDASRSRP